MIASLPLIGVKSDGGIKLFAKTYTLSKILLVYGLTADYLVVFTTQYLILYFFEIRMPVASQYAWNLLLS